MKPIKRILIIRFRQIGDSILAIALCSTLKKSFPDAEIHFVLNKNIAPLYEGHPDIDKVITFDKNENKPFTAYIKKVWQVMHQNKYDIIIDMRSTIRTLFFSLFSLRTPFRIGRIKGYTRFLLNYRTDTYSKDLTTDMVQRNLLLAAPLEKIRPIQYTKEFKLYLTDREKEDFRYYMEKEGIDFAHPVLLIGVTTKLIHKKWNTEFMIATLKRILEEHKDIQMIFNYAPGYEEEDARNIYKEWMSGTYQNRYTSFFIATAGSTLRQLFILLRERRRSQTHRPSSWSSFICHLFTKCIKINVVTRQFRTCRRNQS